MFRFSGEANRPLGFPGGTPRFVAGAVNKGI